MGAQNQAAATMPPTSSRHCIALQRMSTHTISVFVPVANSRTARAVLHRYSCCFHLGSYLPSILGATCPHNAKGRTTNRNGEGPNNYVHLTDYRFYRYHDIMQGTLYLPPMQLSLMNWANSYELGESDTEML